MSSETEVLCAEREVCPHDPEEKGGNKRLAKLAMAALGVVFGDIGTSPLYAIRECFHGDFGIPVTPGNVMGILSLIFWALIIIVTIKYLTFILRADNQGEGGEIALTSLLSTRNVTTYSRQWVLIALGLFASCLLYGDGMITPAISVLSAVEGIGIITPLFSPYILPATVGILVALFFVQRHGTARVGGIFGPVIFLWFVVIGVLGLIQIVQQPRILAAALPWHGIGFLIRNKMHGFIVLGAVFLVVTGAEALYADMGHFGRRPIQLTWAILVLPMLLLNYFGQGALLLARPGEAHHPFYAMVPDWALIPMVLLATVATIIASQAVITGAFSLTRQAIQLGYLPRLRITHTSYSQIGQIYVAPVNWMLMLCTIGLVLGFQSSSKLAAAYGVAVTTTMLITTTLFYVVARRRWGWSRLLAGSLCSLFFLVDFPFFLASISKIFHGAWFPLAIGGFFFIMMLTWEKGREILADERKIIVPTLAEFRERLQKDPPQRVSGQAIFLSGRPNVVPVTLVHNLKHNKILHNEVAILHFRTEDLPRIPNLEKMEIEKLGGGFYQIIVHHGFMEEPKIDKVFALLRDKGIDLKMDSASFYLGRERLSVGAHPRMSRWRSNLFLFMSRNAMDAASFFDVPPSQIIEVGVQLEL
ncbi:MAG: potassium transporter Kup [Deltaproteobacteria bacterium CG_4_10_14_3_um_filter_60_8]|nr:MAG: potassium transporter Kup [Deltaproteobacteria bacterium CG_4_10_14_3_um_filter_60_8]